MGICPPTHAGFPHVSSTQTQALERCIQLCSPWVALIIKKVFLTRKNLFSFSVSLLVKKLPKARSCRRERCHLEPPGWDPGRGGSCIWIGMWWSLHQRIRNTCGLILRELRRWCLATCGYVQAPEMKCLSILH